jgi:hypothetical protein
VYGQSGIFVQRTSFGVRKGLAYLGDGSGRYHELVAKIMAFLGSRLHTENIVKCDFWSSITTVFGTRSLTFSRTTACRRSPSSPHYAVPS